MKRKIAIDIWEEKILPEIISIYGLEGYSFELVSGHEGGRNIVYVCSIDKEARFVLRLSYLNDRNGNYLGKSMINQKNIHQNINP